MIGWDGPDGARRRDRHRDQHIAYWENLDDEGRVVFGGPIRSDEDERSVGSMVVFTADSLEHAQGIIDEDPYVTGAVFESLNVSPFKQVFPKEP
jgi:uncharacterized protein YciI